MDAFQTHKQVIDTYKSYLNSFINIADNRVKDVVHVALEQGHFIPEPLIQFNPSFEKGVGLQSLTGLNSNLSLTFGSYNLFKHQIDALRLGTDDKGFIVTSGTGSGKSLTFIATIFNYIFNLGLQKEKGIKAIIVYPMNALINSQEEEIKKYEINYLKSFIKDVTIDEEGKSLDEIISELEKLTNERFPVTYSKYTGQEQGEKREAIKQKEPDIILTNYMMLELIMTRQGESWFRKSIQGNLKYLVFDELHTYRGRQGSDVSMLIRRIKNWCKNKLICIGTSATMASDGNPTEKKQSVANVASKIFGDTFEIDQIIQEQLVFCSKECEYDAKELEEAIHQEIDVDSNEETFINNPIVNWLELNVALKNNEGTWERGTPQSILQISTHLNEILKSDTNFIVEKIKQILKWAEKLNEKNRKSGKSYLPFRFHQFISQTSHVYVSLEPTEKRFITVEPSLYYKGDDGIEKTLYPILFSRYSGIDFICVTKDVINQKLLPRNPNEPVFSLNKEEAGSRILSEEDFKNGYVVLDNNEEFWEENFVDYAPTSWLNKSEMAFLPYHQWQMPARIYFNAEGAYATQPSERLPYKGYYISSKLQIDPTGGIIYEDAKTRDNTKLASLGNEGRSTATTIISYSVIDSLFNQKEKKENQKLLSFTDSRQDASLQAGHFNDFLATIKLRNAIYRALQKNPNGLNVNNIAEAVLHELNLNEGDYAKDYIEDALIPTEENKKAVASYILYRILQDLKKGWRYILPNLEQTALLKVEFVNLDTLSKMDKEFANVLFFNQISQEQRYEILYNLLNHFRSNFSLNHRYLLDDKNEFENTLKNKLDDSKLWSLDKTEKIDAPNYMVTRKPKRSTQRGIYFASMGMQSSIGKYIKRKMKELDFAKPSKDDFATMITAVCELLRRVHILTLKENIPTNNGPINGYLLKTDCITWIKGNGKDVSFDETRFNAFRDLEIKPNEFYLHLYKSDFTKYEKQIIGREHTGQLSSDDRIDRESKFRKGEISSLFCSPTMELGIDIANLNIVHMRNVPPNPANYAQRSGRAGRSGQTALVFTHCSSYSAHDQHYFKTPQAMVAGVVNPPRIDLINEELITSHFNAYVLMQLGLAELRESAIEVLDISNTNNIFIKTEVQDKINQQIEKYGNSWISGFKETIQFLEVELRNTWWYTDQWLSSKLSSFGSRFQDAFARWISMYQAAKRLVQRSRVIIDDQVLKADSQEKRDAKKQHNVALRQLDLLANNTGKNRGSENEFYVFRYLASEGFLPGYNFTRLPLRAFMGTKHNDNGEYLSRGRGVALKEFAPRNTIYHNGSKYRVDSMDILDAENLQHEIKISKHTGYAFLDNDAANANVDPITNQQLTGDNFEFRRNLIEMTEVQAPATERISCAEEERRASGYDIQEYFSYKNGIDATKQLVVKNENKPLLNLIYDKATELISINRKERRAQQDGFNIHTQSGKWLSAEDVQQPNVQPYAANVMIYTRENADTLYIQPLANLKLDESQVTTLSYALKRAIELMFLLEENEIGVQPMGNTESQNMMLYEASEGSLGILSQLITEPAKLKELFQTTYDCLHFDISTREPKPEFESYGKASYHDLLSYYNQRHHNILDRFSIKETLELLMDCDSEPTLNGKDYDTQYKELLESYDKNSGSELPLLKYLYKNKLALPHKAQVNLSDYFISADFVYNTNNGPVLIFCDGAVHDNEVVKKDDEHKRSTLRNAGYDIIVWHYLEPLDELVKRRKDIFRPLA